MGTSIYLNGEILIVLIGGSPLAVEIGLIGLLILFYLRNV